MDTPVSVAVIIPAHNCATYILEALRSIEAQTRLPTRVVVVDDGSTDATISVVEHFAAKSALPVVVVKQPNRGAAAARNAGVASCVEDLIAFLDADDTFYTPFLERAVEALVQHPELLLCFMDRDVVDSQHAFIRHDLDHPGFRAIKSQRLPDGVSVLTESPFMALVPGTVIPMALVVRRSAFEAVNGFDEQMRLAEDKLFFMQLARVGPFGFLDEPLGIWRRHDNNTSGRRRAFEMVYYSDLVLAKYERDGARLALTEEELQAIHVQRRKYATAALYTASDEARPEFFRVAWEIMKERRAPLAAMPKATLRWVWRRVRSSHSRDAGYGNSDPS